MTGRLVGEIVDGARKAALLRQIAEEEGLLLEQTIAVGDGANDLPMLSVAGLGVAFHAKPVVRERAERAISNVGLDGLLFLIGVREREVRQTLVSEETSPSPDRADKEQANRSHLSGG